MTIEDLNGYVVIERDEYRSLIELAHDSELHKEKFEAIAEECKRLREELKEAKEELKEAKYDVSLYSNLISRMSTFIKSKELYEEYLNARDGKC